MVRPSMSKKSVIRRYGTGMSDCFNFFQFPNRSTLHLSWAGSRWTWQPEADSKMERTLSSSKNSDKVFKAAFKSSAYPFTRYTSGVAGRGGDQAIPTRSAAPRYGAAIFRLVGRTEPNDQWLPDHYETGKLSTDLGGLVFRMQPVYRGVKAAVGEPQS